LFQLTCYLRTTAAKLPVGEDAEPSAVPVDTFVHQFLDSGQVTPIYPVAEQYTGSLKVLVPLTRMTAMLACSGANALAASRTLRCKPWPARGSLQASPPSASPSPPQPCAPKRWARVG